ncbi:MAG TPA: redoxin family protein [Candidatus Acidoferrales bacterium]|jgi:thiol-disulfide isomerase/thioredoxin|nr:redoxin family protein [Candidatus Acidoferrales bacterium]
MRRALLFAFLACAALAPLARAQNSNPGSPSSKAADEAAAKKQAEADAALQKALADAGDDSAALVRNLTAYLARFPDSPRRPSIYRALVEGCQQIRNNDCALDYAERFIALRPDDSQMMLLATSLLQKKGDDASLVRASGYVSRVLDRVEKALPEEKPASESLAEWQDGHSQLLAALYYVRGQIETSQKDYDAAAKDLRKSNSARSNSLASEKLGEIAELRNDPAAAIDEYALAFALPQEGPAGKVDRRDLRRKLGNVWRQVHGSDKGLGDAILAAYDRAYPPQAETAVAPASRNKDAKDAFQFVVRRLDGSLLPFAPLKGKVIVLSFWATWCEPCQELEPLFDQVARNYAGNGDAAFFAVNTDDDETQVAPFVASQKWDVPVIYADGLGDFMKVDSLPTVLILDRSGNIVYRVGGLPPEGFTESLTAAIQKALGVARE